MPEREPTVTIFEAATKIVDAKRKAAGGRVINIVTTGGSLEIAARTAYSKIDGPHGVHFDGMQYRKDIGKREEGMKK